MSVTFADPRGGGGGGGGGQRQQQHGPAPAAQQACTVLFACKISILLNMRCTLARSVTHPEASRAGRRASARPQPPTGARPPPRTRDLKYFGNSVEVPTAIL